MGLKEEKVKVEVFFLPKEYDILKDQAKKENVSMSEYCRLATVCDLVAMGNLKAIQLTIGRMGQKVAEKFAKMARFNLSPEE
jgi:hypothetical protein